MTVVLTLIRTCYIYREENIDLANYDAVLESIVMEGNNFIVTQNVLPDGTSGPT